MGLLDFDDEAILRQVRRNRVSKTTKRKEEIDLEENFGALQNLGTHEQSADFSDSPFADRQPEKKEYE